MTTIHQANDPLNSNWESAKNGDQEPNSQEMRICRVAEIINKENDCEEAHDAYIDEIRDYGVNIHLCQLL